MYFETHYKMKSISRLQKILLVVFSGFALSLTCWEGPPTSLLAQSREAGETRMNRVIELLELKKPAMGIFASDFSTRRATSVASAPIDFVILDMEHAPYDIAQLESYLLAMVNKRRILEKGNLQPDVVPVVRIPSYGRERSQFIIKQVLDLGAFGLLVPHIEDAQEALAAVRAARYAQRKGSLDFEPEGQRGVGYGWAVRYWGLPAPEYAAKADLWPLDPEGELLLWCMVETKKGVRNAREIAAVPGVSGLFVGPSDLAFSLGVSFDDPEVEENLQRILSACKESGIPCGTLTGASSVAKRLKEGFEFLAVGSDSGLSGNVRRAVDIGREFR